jgi:hypothetical protein
MTNAVVARFVGVLTNWAERFAAQSGLRTYSIALPNDFHEGEANGFLRALEAQILNVNEIGPCSLPSIHRPGTKPTEPCPSPRSKWLGSFYRPGPERRSQAARVQCAPTSSTSRAAVKQQTEVR